MPFEWVTPLPSAGAADGADAVLAELHLWPYRSLPKRGFVVFMGSTLSLVLLPLMATLGTPVLWGLLPFIALAIGGVWWGIERSYRDGTVIERLTLSRRAMRLTRDGPRARSHLWEANPHWVTLQAHRTGGPVPHYLTLRGAGREVEIGAFLSEPERRTLEPLLRDALRRVQSAEI